MAVLSARLAAFALVPLLLTGCQIGYYLKGAANQFSMMKNRVPLADALKDPALDAETRAQLTAAAEAHEFAVREIGLKATDNYTTFVQLDRPYASWTVSAAPRWRLEHHEWSYPIVGKMPYKGFFTEEDAREEERALARQDLDTLVRGVTAYSTLGWFKDSVISPMLKMSQHALVNTIIHETTHTTLYIRNSADFNERLASFVGNRGAEQFYLNKEGPRSPTVRRIADENGDERLFSDFIGPELAALKAWYESVPEAARAEALRQEKFKALREKFAREILPRMKTASYKRFADAELNNARLMLYRLYVQDLRDFEELYGLTGGWSGFLACAKTLERENEPEAALKKLNLRLKNANDRSCSEGNPARK